MFDAAAGALALGAALARPVSVATEFESKLMDIAQKASLSDAAVKALAAIEAEAAYNKALADARLEANRIIAEAKADIQADLDKAIAKADAQIAAKAAEGEKAIAEIRATALENVTEVAKDTAKEIVAAMGGKADARSVTAAVNARMKG